MRELNGWFYDGKTSRKKEIAIGFLRTGELRIRGLEDELVYTLSDVRITPRVGNTARCIYLPNGAKCETPDNDAVDAFLRQQGEGKWPAFLHKLESRLVYVLLAVVVSVGSVWALIEYGVPALAKRVAYSLPASVDEALGGEGLSALDAAFFSASELDENRQQELRELVKHMTRALADGHQFRLEFRKGKRVGANAFALPSVPASL